MLVLPFRVSFLPTEKQVPCREEFWGSGWRGEGNNTKNKKNNNNNKNNKTQNNTFCDL